MYNHRIFLDNGVEKWKPVEISWVEVVVGGKHLQLKKQMLKDAVFINSIKCALNNDIYSGMVGYDDFDVFLDHMMIFRDKYRKVCEFMCFAYDDDIDWVNNILRNGFYD